jgi:cytoskeletal protein CcmA (bactofilin family)
MPVPEGAKTTIAEDIEIVGSIKCASNIQLAGKLNGDLACTGTAFISESATIKGNITAESATIQGQVNGNITARDKIDLKATARVNGDIKSKRLTVEDGVTFVGKSEVNPSGAAAGRPAPPADLRVDAAAEADETARRDEADARKPGSFFARK